MATRYYISLPDPARARGNDPELAFRAQGAELDLHPGRAQGAPQGRAFLARAGPGEDLRRI